MLAEEHSSGLARDVGWERAVRSLAMVDVNAKAIVATNAAVDATAIENVIGAMLTVRATSRRHNRWAVPSCRAEV